jgi:hypothetical protein
MGFGAGLGFIAIGAILAFATRFSVSGINVHMIGWILMVVGVVGMLVTFRYTRPRRRGQVVEVIEDEPAAYVAHQDETPPHVYTGDETPPHVYTRDETAPHVYTRREADETGPLPGRYLGDHLG